MISESEMPLEEYNQVELQGYADSIYERLSECKNKTIKKALRNKWKEIATLYNRRAMYEIYKINI